MSANKAHTDLGEQVLETLLYFDIFNYPLKPDEIYKFLHTRCDSLVEVNECLKHLTAKEYIFRFGDLYGLHADAKNSERRVKGNAEAAKWLQVAEKRARFIGRFPYVRAVMASGSLSKGYMDENSDLDFFVVTAPDRLWIARTFLVLYKRVFLRNSHKKFCVNYFVDTAHLEIEEKNLFTATEIATLIPLYAPGLYDALLRSNSWVNCLFPNFRFTTPRESDKSRTPAFKKISEFLLSPVSTWLDKLFMMISLRRWNKLYGDRYSKEDFVIAFKTRRHVSKNHPNHYQKKILERYQHKISEFRNRLAKLTTYE